MQERDATKYEKKKKNAVENKENKNTKQYIKDRHINHMLL